LKDIYIGIENINGNFQAKSELVLNKWFLRQRSVTVPVKTESNVCAELIVDCHYEHLCAREKTLVLLVTFSTVQVDVELL
jgi:hypothetical protein